ncbi:dynactin subunit 6 isoform X1 [Pyrgilauda ruficollis]|uniref:dynactin subunit 6 isoform X1 n=1 Tax=Pyrgilauda ruficollis TaxID=221976 RepID=UPI001B87E293|nr:dynactin subunit 6 isoform X1 [Pyrgilauda ruficollis]
MVAKSPSESFSSRQNLRILVSLKILTVQLSWVGYLWLQSVPKLSCHTEHRHRDLRGGSLLFLLADSQAMKVGDNNVIESKAFVGRNVILTSGCIIGACCNVNTYEVIPENTVIYGADCLRRVQTERPQPQTLQLDFLMKILPNYHHLKKTMKAAATPVKS